MGNLPTGLTKLNPPDLAIDLRNLMVMHRIATAVWISERNGCPPVIHIPETLPGCIQCLVNTPKRARRTINELMFNKPSSRDLLKLAHQFHSNLMACDRWYFTAETALPEIPGLYSTGARITLRLLTGIAQDAIEQAAHHTPLLQNNLHEYRSSHASVNCRHPHEIMLCGNHEAPYMDGTRFFNNLHKHTVLPLLLPETDNAARVNMVEWIYRASPFWRKRIYL